MNLVSKFVNKGPIVLSTHNTHKEFVTLNSVGWQIILEDKNFIEEAKMSRAETYKNLYAKGKLTRRQRNINKLLLIEEFDKRTFVDLTHLEHVK